MHETLPVVNSTTLLPFALGEPIGAGGTPTFEVLKLLNRPAVGDRAFVTLHRKEQPSAECRSGFRNITSWDVNAIDDLLPFAHEELTRDAYHSVNSFYRPGHEWARRKDGRVVRRPPYLPHLLPTYRANDGVRYLAAAYVDIDCDDVGLTPGGVLGVAFELGRRGQLPPFSVFVNSGCGCWLLWRLHEANATGTDGALPPNPRAWPERQDLYRRIQAHVTSLPELLALGADSVKDPARIMRLAGSVNTKAGSAVYALPQLVNGRVPSYTLDQLAAAFGVVVPVPVRKAFAPWSPRERVRHADGDRMPAKARGLRRRWQYVLADVLSLVTLRGGRLSEGCRQSGCCALATALRHLGVCVDEQRRQVYALADASRLPRHEADRAIAAAERYATAQPAYREFANWLKVTPEEAEELNKLPAAGCAPSPAVFHAKRNTAARRAELRRYVDALGFVPPLTAATLYLSAAGYPVTVMTVRNDYERMKLRRAERRGRRRKNALPLLTI